MRLIISGVMKMNLFRELKEYGLDAFDKDLYSDKEVHALLKSLLVLSEQRLSRGIPNSEVIIRKKILPYIKGYTLDSFKVKIKRCIYHDYKSKDSYWQVRVKGHGVLQAAEILLFHFLDTVKEDGEIIRRKKGCKKGCANPYHIEMSTRSELSSLILDKHINVR